MADQALEIKDFSGGMTDNYVAGPLNKFQAMQNFVIRSDLKAESRFGSSLLDSTYYQLPGGATKRGDAAVRFKSSNIFQQENKLHHLKAGVGYTEIVGPSSNSAFSTATVQYDQCSFAEWNNHLLVTSDRREKPKFIFKDGTDFRLRNIGLPAINTSGITFSAGLGASRGYAFCYKYTYTIDGVDFVMRGPISYKQYTGAIANSIGSIPVLSNGSTNSYDTANIKIEIYRTVDAGTVYYLTAEITNGTTSTTDSTSDVNLPNGILLYTEAGDLDYDEPPECKYLMQLNGVVYYCNVKDSLGDIYPNRINLAAPDQIYAAYAENYIDVDGDITAVGVAGQNALVFTADKTYRIEGFYFSDGSGGPQKVEVSRTVGCISSTSVVSTQDGCFFAAKDGFYFTDGYKVLRISEDINQTYAASTSTESIRKKIYGAHDAVNKRLYFAACSNYEQSDVNIIFVANLYFGIRADVPFTIWDGGYWASNFSPTSLLFYSDMLVTTDKRGYVLKYADGQLNDLKINTAVLPSSWTNYPIIYDLRTAATDFGSVTTRKWVSKAVLYADSESRAAVRMMSNNDNSGVFVDLAEVKSNSPVLWGDSPTPLWGDTTIRWNYLPIITASRRMPSPLRCSYKQMRVTNSYTLIDSSDYSGQVSVDATTKQITLLTGTYAWDVEVVDYYISFASDNYVNQFRISTRNSATVITAEDTSNLMITAASVNFKIMGYRKSESIRLLSLSMIYDLTTPTQTPPAEATA